MASSQETHGVDGEPARVPEDVAADAAASSVRHRRMVGLSQAVVFVPPLVGLLVLAGLGALAWQVVPSSRGWFASHGLTLPDRDAFVASLAVGAFLMLLPFGLSVSKLRVMLRIRGALHAFGSGERSVGALRVCDRPGAARSWNRLLEWREEEAFAGRVGELLSSGSSVSGGGVGERAADALWQGVLVVDEQQVVRYANGAAAVLLRQRRENVPGKDARTIIPDDHVLEAIGQALTAGSRQRRVLDVGDPTAEEASVLRFSVRSIGAKGDRSALVVIEDVTQQRVSDSAQHAFVAQATHELRTPLTNMRLYVEQLIDDDLSAEERGTALNVVNGEISRLDRIVGDMLSIAEIQAGNLHAKSSEVRVQPLFEQLRRDYAESAKRKGLVLDFDLPPKYPSIVGDREKISIVLHNMLGNAVKYTPEGGTVRVVVKEEGDRLVTEVSDTGIGISEEDQGRIFERFARANDDRVKEQVGTGLGLALARDIARLHNGDITVHSEPNQGSTFVFWLPVSVGTQALAA